MALPGLSTTPAVTFQIYFLGERDFASSTGQPRSGASGWWLVSRYNLLQTSSNRANAPL